MPELNTLADFWRLLDEGSTPILGIISYFLWKIERALNEFIVEIRSQQSSRDTKIDSVHSDIGAIIRKLAGLNGAT